MKKIARVGLMFLSILLSLKNNLYAYMMTSEEEIQNYNIVNVMIICFFLFIAILMIVYAIYIFPKLRSKNDENSEESETKQVDEDKNLKDENKIRYLVATIVLLAPILYIIFALIVSGLTLVGLIILGALILYNCYKKFTHLERFYHNAKIFLVIIIVYLIYKYINIFILKS